MMKLSLSQLIGASALAFSLAITPSLSASAQTSPTTPDTTTPDTTIPDTTIPDTTTPDTTIDSDAGEDRDFDWGWLGLIGLAGLAGLRRKHDEPTVTSRDPVEPTTRSRY